MDGGYEGDGGCEGEGGRGRDEGERLAGLYQLVDLCIEVNPFSRKHIQQFNQHFKYSVDEIGF